jgi:ribosomal-protein-serine acetyltransferase
MEPLPGEIRTSRTLLRVFDPDDVDTVSAAVAANVEHLRPWMPWVVAEPLSAIDRVALICDWHQQWQRGGDAQYGVFRDGALVGACGLHHRSAPTTLEIGYWIAGQHVGQGLATEVSAALTAAAFTRPTIDTVEIHHDKANVASSRVPDKLGFSWVGETPDGVTALAEVGLDWCWRMERSDWPHGDGGC